MVEKKLIAYTVVERKSDGKKLWVRIGDGFRQRDGSIEMQLDALPTNGSIVVPMHGLAVSRVDGVKPPWAPGEHRSPPETAEEPEGSLMALVDAFAEETRILRGGQSSRELVDARREAVATVVAGLEAEVAGLREWKARAIEAAHPGAVDLMDQEAEPTRAPPVSLPRPKFRAKLAPKIVARLLETLRNLGPEHFRERRSDLIEIVEQEIKAYDNG